MFLNMNTDHLKETLGRVWSKLPRPYTDVPLIDTTVITSSSNVVPEISVYSKHPVKPPRVRNTHEVSNENKKHGYCIG